MNPSSLMVASLVLTLMACSGNNGPRNPNEPSISVGQEFELAPGQTASVGPDGLRVTFQGVRNDSRCARDVTCIWEGDALVALTVVRSSRPQADVELHTNTGQGPGDRTYEGYRVRLVKLAPQPLSTSQTDPASYRATLVVDTAS